MTYPFSTPNPVTKYDEITYVPKRAMVIFAHPDDAEIGAGATAALWAAQGTEITYVQCTTGSSGSNDTAMTSERIVEIRTAEQRAAADAIGVGDIVFLDHPDGELEADRVFLGEVVHALRKYRPEVVFSHDQHRVNGFQHRDHRHVGITVQDAIYPYARDHLHFPEHLVDGIEPYKVKHIFFWGTDQPNVIVDVSNSVDTKIEALSKHESQLPGLSFGSDMDLRMRGRHSDAAKGYGFKYGESFRRLTART
jgi:LmbE family N-acetylglucosaminyl deacetylase